ncbi:hypothetical protein [Actinomycetospora callitridis]|uniref:hypothetical protein n=1 Tax=Actinomycetospora callitridis TaxID=913944 RepID=UPI002365B178|nr:hypothetical protein [Actinomycetospora callitridis]MDD7920485.1 hypothetical protein [Actinomycetospora callitridis]
MATPTADEARDQALDVIAQAQEAGIRFAGSVAESWASVLRGIPGVGSALGADTPGSSLGNSFGGALGTAGVPHTAVEAVDRFYDTGVQLLEAQRSAAHHVLGAMGPALRPLISLTPPAARR